MLIKSFPSTFLPLFSSPAPSSSLLLSVTVLHHAVAQDNRLITRFLPLIVAPKLESLTIVLKGRICHRLASYMIVIGLLFAEPGCHGPTRGSLHVD